MSILDNIPGVTVAKMAASGIVGAFFAGGLFLAWNTFIDNPRVKDEAERRVTAELTANFFKATGDLTDAADEARAARRWCRDAGLVYDAISGKC